MAKWDKGKEVASPLVAGSIPTYQSANQPQPSRAKDNNSQFKTLKMFMNVISDDYTISVPMP